MKPPIAHLRTRDTVDTLWQLDDRDFADDLALLSQALQLMQEKINSLVTTATQVGWIINKGMTKILKVNTTTVDPIKLEGQTRKEVEAFSSTWAVSSISRTNADVKARIGKGRAAFLQLKNVCKSEELGLQIKVRLFNSNVKFVLQFKSVVTIMKKVQTFINTCPLKESDTSGVNWGRKSRTKMPEDPLLEVYAPGGVVGEIMMKRYTQTRHLVRLDTARGSSCPQAVLCNLSLHWTQRILFNLC